MVSLHCYIRDSVYNIRIGEETIQATADHPFFISGRWLRVAELKVGDSVKIYNGSNLAIEQITIAPGRTTVYNFEVEDYHTYYVSNTKVLVHNIDPGDVKTPTPRVKSSKKLRKEWEDAEGKDWPKEPSNPNQNQVVSHKEPLADGGYDGYPNTEPMPAAKHTKMHKERGNFRRWGGKRKK